MAKHEVAHCEICGAQWVVRAPSDTKGCSFCGAPEEFIWVEDESNPQDR